MIDIQSDEDSYQEEVVNGGTYPPNARVAKLEEEAFLDSLKQYKHVQPRIDPDNYQAELPEMITPENQPPDHDFQELTHRAKVDWYKSTRCTHSTEQQEVVDQWLVMSRNIFEPFKFRGTPHWTGDASPVPLESDAKAIAFLASNDYNLEKAQFNLLCHMGMGKDLNYVKRTSDLIAKQPVAAIFSEMKEKFLRSGATKPMLGAYTHLEKDLSSAVKDPPSGVAPSSSKYSPRDPTKDDKTTAAANGHVVNYFDSAFPLSYAQSKCKGDTTSSSSNNSVEDKMAMEDTNGSERGGSNRGLKDKSETKKRWMHILKEGCTLLQRKLENPSEKPPAGIRRANRGATVAAEALLDEAGILGQFYDSPGDDFAEHLRVILGELIKQTQLAREWVAELRDLLRPGLCFHGPRAKASKTKLKDLREHLKRCDSLQLMPPEEANLKTVIADIQSMNASVRQLFSHLKIGAEGVEGEVEGEMPHLPEILESISNNTMVASESQSIDWIPTMEDVSNILNAAQHLHADIPVRTFLEKLWEKANDLIYEVEYFLDRAQACRVRTKARSIGASGKKHTLADARQLQKKVLDFPLDIGLLPNLEAVIVAGETWQREVQAIASQGDRGKGGSQRQRDRENAADGNKTGSASMKRVESLIAEGEKSVFNFEKELDVLKDRRAQAKQWLDKLKNSFRPKSKHNARSKAELGEDGQPVGPPVKMALSDMRLMVEEGADLLDEESRGTATARELGKAQSVVDIAEEWLSRVREALATGGSNQDISELQELIGESDDMPVYMEEAVVLRSHFSAMEWAKKARKVLYLHPPGYMLAEVNTKNAAAAAARADRAARRKSALDGGYSVAETDKDIDDGNENAMAVDVKNESATSSETSEEAEAAERRRLEELRVFAFPRLSEVQKHYVQIIKIREAVPAHISAEFSLRPLIEESDTIEIVERAEAWLNAAKKVMLSGAIKKGGKLKKMREMYLEAKDFKINFEAELKPFRLAIVAAENWIASNADVIGRLNIPMSLERTVELEEGDEDYEEWGRHYAGMATDSATAAQMEPASKKLVVEEQVTYNLLQRSVLAGEPLLLEFTELDEARKRLLDTDVWILRMKEMCSKSGEEIIVRKRIKASTDASADKSAKDKKVDGRVRRADLVQLQEEAEMLRLNLNREREIVQKCIAASDVFDSDVLQALDGEIKEGTNKMIADLHTTLQSKPEALAAAFERVFPSPSSVDFNPYENEVDDDSAEEFDQTLMPVLYDFISHTRAESERKAAAAKLAVGSDPIVESLNGLIETVDSLQVEALHIGVSTPATLTLDIYMSALEWVEEVRGLLYPMEERKTARGNPSSKIDPSSLLMPEWGNLKQETLLAFINDAAIAVPMKARADFTAQYEGGLLEYVITAVDAAEDILNFQRRAFSCTEANAFQKLTGLCLPAVQRRLKKETETKTSVNAGENGSGAGNGGDEVDLEAADIKQRVSRKRKSKDKSALDAESAPVASAQNGGGAKKRGRAAKDIKVDEEAPLPVVDADADEANEQDAGPIVEPVEDSDADEGEGYVSKFSQYKKDLISAKGADAAAASLVPENLQRLLDFYMRCLGLALLRTCEVDQWRKSCNAVTTRALGLSSGAKRCVGDVLYLLRYGDYRGYYLKERTSLENEALKVRTWTNLAAAMKSRQNLMAPDDLKAWVRDGEHMIFDHPYVREMKEEYRKAKAWVVKLHATGIEKGLAKTSDLQELLPEVEAVCADLSAFTESIYATTKSYCLCRQAYFGLMVGCDSCDDWYHAPCIGLSKAQAERTEAFICFRCNIVDSFRLAAANAGSIANKWMLKADVVTKRENDKQRILKKVQREERELDRIQQAMDMHITFMARQQADVRASAGQQQSGIAGLNAPTSALASAALSSLPGIAAGGVSVDASPIAAAVLGQVVIDSSAPPSLEKVLGSADPNQVKRYETLRAEHLDGSKRLSEARKENENNDAQANLEMAKAPVMIAWMQRVQAIVWPANTAEEAAGAPKGDEAAFVRIAEHGQDYVDQLGKLLSQTLSAPLLPSEVCVLASQAISDQLDKTEDVLSVVEMFRWMSWCSILLRTLRHPPTSVIVRKMLDVARTISVADERIIRFLQNIIVRSQVWKTKARKMLYYNTPSQPYMTNKRVDTIRANNLLLEGNQIPITSRIKDVLRIQLKNVARAETPMAEPALTADDDADEGKRSRAPSKKSDPSPTAVSVPQITHITFTGELPDSSDEDIGKPGTATYSHAIHAQYVATHGQEGAPPLKRSLVHFPTPVHMLAETKPLWPVALSQPRKALTPWNEKRLLAMSIAVSDSSAALPSAPVSKKNRAE